MYAVWSVFAAFCCSGYLYQKTNVSPPNFSFPVAWHYHYVLHVGAVSVCIKVDPKHLLIVKPF